MKFRRKQWERWKHLELVSWFARPEFKWFKLLAENVLECGFPAGAWRLPGNHRAVSFLVQPGLAPRSRPRGQLGAARGMRGSRSFTHLAEGLAPSSVWGRWSERIKADSLQAQPESWKSEEALGREIHLEDARNPSRKTAGGWEGCEELTAFSLFSQEAHSGDNVPRSALELTCGLSAATELIRLLSPGREGSRQTGGLTD